MKKNIFIITGIAAFIVACTATNHFQPAESELPIMQQKVPGITYERVIKGFRVYKTNCSGCHKLHLPTEYSKDGWEKVLPEMLEKARLNNPDHIQFLKDYLFANSK